MRLKKQENARDPFCPCCVGCHGLAPRGASFPCLVGVRGNTSSQSAGGHDGKSQLIPRSVLGCLWRGAFCSVLRRFNKNVPTRLIWSFGNRAWCMKRASRPTRGTSGRVAGQTREQVFYTQYSVVYLLDCTCKVFIQNGKREIDPLGGTAAAAAARFFTAASRRSPAFTAAPDPTEAAVHILAYVEIVMDEPILLLILSRHTRRTVCLPVCLWTVYPPYLG